MQLLVDLIIKKSIYLISYFSSVYVFQKCIYLRKVSITLGKLVEDPCARTGKSNLKMNNLLRT